MNRIALVGVILAVLLAADGIYMVVSNYNDGETQVFGLLDGWIVVTSAAVVLLASLLAFALSSRSVKTAKLATPQSAARPEVKSEQA
jgi:drug/metabolite transporter (DMT)-like permease